MQPFRRRSREPDRPFSIPENGGSKRRNRFTADTPRPAVIPAGSEAPLNQGRFRLAPGVSPDRTSIAAPHPLSRRLQAVVEFVAVLGEFVSDARRDLDVQRPREQAGPGLDSVSGTPRLPWPLTTLTISTPCFLLSVLPTSVSGQQ